MNLLAYIRRIIKIQKGQKDSQSKSMAKINHEYFQLHRYIEFDDISLLVRKLYEENVGYLRETTQV